MSVKDKAGPRGGRGSAPLKVDPEIDRLITHVAHFMNVTKKDLVAIAVTDYVARHREEMRARTQGAMSSVLDVTDRSRVALLTGLTPEQRDAVGGVPEDE
ncbi:hypothetical protein ACIO3O_07080 [Streptomyces sp. NPDC087440]|uniref:hypothetical protein n=1 Tax=Streptomyces sp. NPDC087440 TaxID=3365790 RepID=UPI00382493F4